MSSNLERMADLTEVTPMMAQYVEIKRNYPDTILMYRLGDFYEMFFEDAVKASRAAELTLTGRDCGNGKRAAMCGVPFHKVDVYIGRLVAQGYKIAICEQTEDPAAAKGIVRREVIRVVTPGTVTDASLLPDRDGSFLAAAYITPHGAAVAFADVSTGHVYTTVCPPESDPETSLRNELGVYMPREVLLNIPAADCRELCDYISLRCDALLTPDRADLYDFAASDRDVTACFGRDRLPDRGTVCAVGALLAYIRETQKVSPDFLRELHVYTSGQYLEMDAGTQRSLELTETMRRGEKKGSLLSVIDTTRTSMGARLLRSWVKKPLCDPIAISHRQSAVRELLGDFLCREQLRDMLSGILDIERLTAKAIYGTANARDLLSLAMSLQPLPDIRAGLAKSACPELHRICEELDPMEDLYTLLRQAIVDEPPITVREAGMIRRGYSAEVDRLRSIKANGSAWMQDIERREAEATGIKGLKVGYNKVFGYYIEVTKSQNSLVPPTYIRKQTLTGAERYITEELKEMETTMLTATDRLCAVEYELFTQLRDRVVADSDRLLHTASVIASLDIFLSFADVASKLNFVCPEVDLSEVIEIKDGRHPVVEVFSSEHYFVPNDTTLNTGSCRTMLITGPNMAGKSTYMRQVALIVLLAQIGSFVPAAEAHIGIVDRIFTRVGASDDLASGQSTFMLEMTEVAYILRNATRRSLLIYDEVGRGTSTYDGMSIARAVVEYSASKKLGARTMFATHYHELTELEGSCEGVVNYHIAAKKRGDDIIFLRKIVRGATDDSYGIEVAKLAGVPSEVVRRAREVLRSIESQEQLPRRSSAAPQPQVPDMFTELCRREADEVADKLRATDINTLTPIEAMNMLFGLKKLLSDTSK